MSLRGTSCLFTVLGLIAVGAFASNPVDVHGRLQTQGNRIVGAKSGDTVQLTGVSLTWHHWAGQYYNTKTVDWLADDFHCSVVRAAVVGDLEPIASDSAVISAGRKLADSVVFAATRRGIYTIIDWQSRHAPIHVGDAKAFFDSMATRHGGNPGVIFEIFAEPWANVYTWAEIKGYALEIIPIIRKHSKNLILIGTRGYSRYVDEASLDPINDSNIAYAFHFNAGSQNPDTTLYRARTAMDNGIPLFVSEWATTNEDGGTVDKKVYADSTARYFEWIDSNKISSCNWGLKNKDESSSILVPGTDRLHSWNLEKDLTESGRLVRGMVRARNSGYTFDPPPIDSTLPPIDTTPAPVDTNLLGRIEAESTSVVSNLKVSGPEGADSVVCLGFSSEGSWAEYSVSIPNKRKGVIALRLSCGYDSGKVTIKLNDTVVQAMAFKGTGSWVQWTTLVSDSLALRAGTAKVRLEWNSSFNLDWISLSGRKIVEGTTEAARPSAKPRVLARITPNGCLIDFGESIVGQVRLLDSRGRTLATQSISGVRTISLNGSFPKGLALLRFEGREESRTTPLIFP